MLNMTTTNRMLKKIVNKTGEEEEEGWVKEQEKGRKKERRKRTCDVQQLGDDRAPLLLVDRERVANFHKDGVELEAVEAKGRSEEKVDKGAETHNDNLRHCVVCWHSRVIRVTRLVSFEEEKEKERRRKEEKRSASNLQASRQNPERPQTVK